MRLFPLLVVLLAFPGQAQVVPITGRVSAPVSGANAGAYQTPGAGLSLSPNSGAFLAPSLIQSSLGAPAIAPLETALALPTAKIPSAATAETKTNAIAVAPAALTPVSAALETKLSAPAQDDAHEDSHKGSDPKNANQGADPKKDETGSDLKNGEGGFEDGRAMFDGSGDKPNEPVDAGDQNEPTQAEIESAFGPARKPVKAFLKKFGVAGALLTANSIAYSAVPNDGTETGTLAHLAFDPRQFVAAVQDLSLSGIAESAWRGLTSMFMHAHDAHLLGNMMMLALFAPWVQSALGARRTMAIYLLGGLAAAFSYAFISSADLILGASAAISALMGAALTVWTKPKNGESVDIFRVSFQVFAAYLILKDVKSLIFVGPVTPEHVATLAHVVGAGVGLILGGWYALRARRLNKEAAE